jgi:CBS-domain-containing membrane protein
MDRFLKLLGYIKPADLLVLFPDLVQMVDDKEEVLEIQKEQASRLLKEAETKLENAKQKQVEIARQSKAVNSFRTALGERK